MTMDIDSVKDYLNGVYTDFLMLKDETWEPDSKSISASIYAIEKIAEELEINLTDTRDN